MNVYKKVEKERKALRQRLRPNIWWFMVFVMCFILVVFGAIAETKAQSESSVALPLSPTIAIDAGHGGIDVGASANGLLESQLNLEIALKLQNAIESLSFQTVMTRTDDNGLYGTTQAGFKKRDMQARKEICESAGADMLISIHQNASTIPDRTGVVIYCDKLSSESVALATAVANQFENGVVKFGDFFITSEIDMPSIIVECGFITTASESEKLASEEYQEDIANSIARGVLIYQREQMLS